VLDEGIKGLMIPDSELQVATTTYVDPTTFYQDVAHISPDVIVMGAVKPLDQPQICELLHGASSHKVLRWIIVRLEDNIVEVYDKQSLKPTRNKDLLRLITER
jgi:hypothetical protein